MRYQQSDTGIDSQPDMRLQPVITQPRWIRKAEFCPDAELIPIEFLVSTAWCTMVSLLITQHTGHWACVVTRHYPPLPCLTTCPARASSHNRRPFDLFKIARPQPDGELSLDGVKWLVSEASSDCDRSSEPDPGHNLNSEASIMSSQHCGQIKFPSQRDWGRRGWFE